MRPAVINRMAIEVVEKLTSSTMMAIRNSTAATRASMKTSGCGRALTFPHPRQVALLFTLRVREGVGAKTAGVQARSAGGAPGGLLAPPQRSAAPAATADASHVE